MDVADDVRFLLDVIEASLETGWDRGHGDLFYLIDAESLSYKGQPL